MDINDPEVEKQVDRLIATIEAEGRPVFDKDNKKTWIKDKLNKGFSMQLIYQSLKANNFDFVTTGAYLDNMSKGREKAQKAIEEVTALKQEKEKKERSEKKSAHLSYVITAYIISAIGFFMAYIIQKNLGEVIGIIEEGPIGGFMHTFVKAGWIVGITGAAVGTLLVAFMLADYFKRKAKKQQAEDIEASKKAQSNVSTQTSQTSAQPVSQHPK